jgi:hypothetical protein
MIAKCFDKIETHVSSFLLATCVWYFYIKYIHYKSIKLHKQSVENDFYSLIFHKLFKSTFFSFKQECYELVCIYNKIFLLIVTLWPVSAKSLFCGGEATGVIPFASSKDANSKHFIN